MNIERYVYLASESFLDFKFESEGPKGKIKKIVRFSPENANGITYFNLGFGDLNEETGQIDDLAISNNSDRNKILATVAATVLEFTQHFPDVMIYFKGSTTSRTRLYQMGITSNWKEIETIFHVYGYVSNNGWQSFKKNVSYEAFLILRK